MGDDKEEKGMTQATPSLARRQGDTGAREDYHRHKCLQLALLMEAEIHRLLLSGEPDTAIVQSCCNLETLSTCLRRGGTWEEAWELQYRPGPHKRESDAALAERLAVGQRLRREGTVERIIAAARAADRK